MQQIIYFFLRNKNLLLFLFLFLFSIFVNFKSNAYTSSKIINSGNEFVGYIYNHISGIKNYFNLIEQNKKLVDEASLFLEWYWPAIYKQKPEKKGSLTK